jgi:hypothetical protein
MQQCMHCNSTTITRYWLRDLGMYLRCDECLKEFFDDGSPVATRFELHMRIKTLEDKLKHKDGEISLMKMKIDMLCCNAKLLENKLDEVYFAPDMPGYMHSKQNFDSIALE